jgi:hypothetical protein
MCRALVALGRGRRLGRTGHHGVVRRPRNALVRARSALGAGDEPTGVGQRSPKLPATADAELGEHLRRCDSTARTDEQLRANDDPVGFEIFGSVVASIGLTLAYERPVGFRPIELDAEPEADHDQIVWKPGGNALPWLRDELGRGLQQAEWDRPLVGRFIIDGWGIMAEQDPKLHLNGHGNTVIDANGHTQLILPTDDEVTGGQFIQWFFLE